MANSQTINDHFASGEDFEDALSEAIRNASTGHAIDFVSDLKAKWEQYGVHCRMSKQQYQWLARLAKLED